ncbi:leucine-rich repeat protein [Butyrivibrio sp. VCD2006]|uniref:leucine-rich repeat protein n=1 Tax=Butyrivibrio sp. VCD2006 TaxID=1280664 RepID=UPI00042061AF|nr:leucine-rich repeat protein [Butyrivibrio sp. VCD2006]
MREKIVDFKRIAVMGLSAALFICQTPMRASAGTGDSTIPQGMGTEASPYFVYNTAHLNYAVTNGGYAELDADLENMSWFTIKEDKKVTLNLNGHTINRGLNTAKHLGYIFDVEGELVINDASTFQEGKITGGYSDNNCGAIYVGAKGQLTLNGGNITGNKAARYAGGVCVSDGGVFTMNGGSIAGNSTEQESGGGVEVANGAVFNMYGGSIYSNSSGKYGGGVNNRGIFNMTEGKIYSNSSSDDGGGVSNHKTFNMLGGEIYSNSSDTRGGGVYNENIANMNGGSITKNTARKSGGGVYNVKTFNMKGGSIKENIAWESGGGVYGVLNVENGAEIIGNTLIGGTVKQNVYIPGDDTITVTDDLSGTIGVTLQKSNAVFAKADANYNGGKLKESDADGFVTDDGSVCFLNDNKEMEKFSQRFLESEYIVIDDLLYNGKDQTGEVKVKYLSYEMREGTDYDVAFEKDDENALQVLEAGDYTAVITGRGRFDGVVRNTFSVKEKEITISGIKAKNKEYDGTTDAEFDCSEVVYGGICKGDSLTVSVKGNFIDAEPGTDKDVIITEITLGGTSKDNYIMARSGQQTGTKATINKVAPMIVRAPSAINGLFANGNSHQLINAGMVNGGKFVYALGADSVHAPADIYFTEAIPAATMAGDYSVWYKVKGEGYFGDTEPVCITVKIAGEPETPTDSETPGTNPGNAEESTNIPAEVPQNTPAKTVEAQNPVGTQFKDEPSKAYYIVVQDEDGKPAVNYIETYDINSKNVIIPDFVEKDGISYAVKEISAGAFKNNKKITSVKIGKNVTVIGNKSFLGCKSLKSIKIPATVNRIGSNAFKGCSNLKKLNIKTKTLTAKSVGKNAFKGINSKATVKVPGAAKKSYGKFFYKKGLPKNAIIK